MVTYKDLEPGKKYKLGDIIVGKFVKKNGTILTFLDSQFGERNENEIDIGEEGNEEDDFIEIKRASSTTPKSRKRGGKGKRGGKSKTKRSKKQRK